MNNSRCEIDDFFEARVFKPCVMIMLCVLRILLTRQVDKLCWMYHSATTRQKRYVCYATSYAVGFGVSWKSPFQQVCMSCCPGNVGNWSFSPQNLSYYFSPRSIWGCFPRLQAPRYRKLPTALFRSHSVKYDPNAQSDRKKRIFLIQSPIAIIFAFPLIWIGKVRIMISCNRALREAVNASWLILERLPTHSGPRKTQISTFPGLKLMRTCWKGLFHLTVDPTE